MFYPMLPTLTNGTSYAMLKARDVHRLAMASLVEIEGQSNQAANAAARQCLEEYCVHRIPFLGIPYYRHKRYPSMAIALEHAPEVAAAKMVGWGDRIACEKLRQMALWLMYDSGYPEELQVMQISVNDFYSLL